MRVKVGEGVVGRFGQEGCRWGRTRKVCRSGGWGGRSI